MTYLFPLGLIRVEPSGFEGRRREIGSNLLYYYLFGYLRFYLVTGPARRAGLETSHVFFILPPRGSVYLGGRRQSPRVQQPSLRLRSVVGFASDGEYLQAFAIPLLARPFFPHFHTLSTLLDFV